MAIYLVPNYMIYGNLSLMQTNICTNSFEIVMFIITNLFKKHSLEMISSYRTFLFIYSIRAKKYRCVEILQEK